MPKVCQMLDAGWKIRLFKNDLGTYTALAVHQDPQVETRCKYIDKDGDLVTDDHTPEQALTRLAYKVLNEILSSQG